MAKNNVMNKSKREVIDLGRFNDCKVTKMRSEMRKYCDCGTLADFKVLVKGDKHIRWRMCKGCGVDDYIDDEIIEALGKEARFEVK